MAKDKNYVSFWFWLFAILISGIPCTGLLFSIPFAFAGENESRKNFFKASLTLHLLGLLLLILLHLFGIAIAGPKMLQELYPELWKAFGGR